MIELGSKVKDKITGFEGIAIARFQWLTGCERYEVLPDKLSKDGAPRSSETFDEKRLTVLKGPTKELASVRDTGGPTPTPRQPSGPRD